MNNNWNQNGYREQATPAPTEGDVRYSSNLVGNKVMLAGRVMKCSRMVNVNNPNMATIVDVMISSPGNDNAFNIITLMGRLADRALDTMDIGAFVGFECCLNPDRYQDRAGNDHYVTNIVANSWQFWETTGRADHRRTSKVQRGGVVEGLYENYMRTHSGR